MTKQKSFFLLIPLLVLIAILSFRIVFSERLEEFSFRIFDKFQHLQPRTYQAIPVRFVDIDEESLQKFGQWPWPRTLLADLVSKLSKQGAAVIVFDILFAEADRTSPENILPLWTSLSPEIQSLLPHFQQLPKHDHLFAQTLNETPTVLGFTLTGTKAERLPLLKAGFAHSGDDPKNFLPKFKGAVTNLPQLEQQASGNGSFNFIADADGVLRRVPLIFKLEDQLVPSLVAESLRVAQGASSYVIKSSGSSGETGFGERTGIISIKIGSLIIPTDAEGKIWLYDTGKVKSRYLPAWKILEETVDSRFVDGHIIFIGSSAAGLKDLRVTPLNPIAAGTEVHAQLAEQILQEQFLIRPDWAIGAEMVFLLLLGLCLIFLLPRLGALWCAFIGLTFISFAFGFSWHAFSVQGLLFEPVTPSIATLFVYLTVSLLNYLRTESEKQQVRGAFSRYVSPALLQRISDHPEQLKLGGETRNMTVLFSDIRNFTNLSEQMNAEELTHFMNRYLTPMTDIILKSFGTIDKYIGDSIMAFWNAPVEDPQHARHACEAALAMRKSLKNWNQEMQKEAESRQKKFSPISIGIGLNTGECSVGNMGSDQRFDYSVLGDDVNLASRLESQTKYYGVDIIIGAKTCEEAKDFAVLELDLILVKGKNRPVKIYGLLGDKTLKQDAGFEKVFNLHQKMLKVYRERNWEEASDFLKQLWNFSEAYQLQKFYQLYESRVKFYRFNPPAADWEGVYEAAFK